MGINAQLIDCNITHQRFIPKEHKFRASFFWFSLDLDSMDEDFKQIRFVSRNKFNLFEFRDRDHIDFGAQTLRENVEAFLLQNGEAQIPVKITLWTHLRFLGYVFNPVSFYVITMADGSFRAIIEVGNTFNEIKPYYVDANAFEGKRAQLRIPKNFYVSPFIALDAIFTFKLNFSDSALSIGVLSDAPGGETILAAGLSGKFHKLSNRSLFKRMMVFPFVTLKVIGLIHWHALLLWLKRIPFIKKK